MCVKVKAKITKVNKIIKAAKKKEVDMAGAQSVQDDETNKLIKLPFSIL